jgi:hypothetical protein
MRKLHARLEHLERRATAHLACHCWQVIRDEEPEQETCPHGRPWAGIIRLVHDERPDPA